MLEGGIRVSENVWLVNKSSMFSIKDTGEHLLFILTYRWGVRGRGNREIPKKFSRVTSVYVRPPKLISLNSNMTWFNSVFQLQELFKVFSRLMAKKGIFKFTAIFDVVLPVAEHNSLVGLFISWHLRQEVDVLDVSKTFLLSLRYIDISLE